METTMRDAESYYLTDFYGSMKNIDDAITITQSKLKVAEEMTHQENFYEFQDTRNVFVKPHFDLDWSVKDGWGQNEDDWETYAYSGIQLICDIFNCDQEDVCVLFDKKYDNSKLSIHFVVPKLKCDMRQLVSMKEKHKKKMEDIHLDTGIYRVGQNKWRPMGATKKIDGKATSDGFALWEENLKDWNYQDTIIYNTKGCEMWDYPIPTEKPKKRIRIKKPSVPASISSDGVKTDDPVKNEHHTETLLERLLNAIDVKHIERYSEWFKIGAICYNEEEGNLDLFKRISKRSSRYVAEADESCENVWKSYANQHHKKATIKSLYSWLREENPKLYQEIIGMNDFDFSSFGNWTVAEYFVENYAEDFLIQPSPDGYIMYHYNEKTSIWDDKSAEKKIHNILSKNVYFDLKFILKQAIDKLAQEKESAPEDQKDMYSKQIKDLEKQGGYIKTLLSNSTRNSIVKDIYNVMEDQDEFQFNYDDKQLNKIHFRNGCLEITDSGYTFRPRLREDFMSGFNDYDWIEPPQAKIDKITDVLKKIMPQQDEFESMMSWSGYCCLGYTDQQVSKMNVGYTASNGKTTQFQIHKNSMPFYTNITPKNFFAPNNEKRHKPMVSIFMKQPTRLCLFEEVDEKIDVGFYKDFVNGKPLSFEKLFGSEYYTKNQTKVEICSNTDPNTTFDKGFMRRMRVQLYNSQFTNKLEKVDEANHIYLGDSSVESLAEYDDEIKCAYIKLLLPYMIKFMKTHKLAWTKANEDAIVQIANERDEFRAWIHSDAFEKDPSGRVSKKMLLTLHQTNMSRKLNWDAILPKMKQMGYSYKWDLKMRKQDLDSPHLKPEWIDAWKKHQGCVIGLRYVGRSNNDDDSDCEEED